MAHGIRSRPGARRNERRPGKVRQQRYEDLLRAPAGPIDLSRGDFEDLFFEPLYQLMRQQLLASAIEESAEDGVAVCSVLHVSPRGNEALKRVTALRSRERYGDPDLFGARTGGRSMLCIDHSPSG